MKAKVFVVALCGLLVGVAIGAAIATTQTRARLSDAAKPEVLALLPSDENAGEAEWNEFRKHDWHVAVVWVN